MTGSANNAVTWAVNGTSGGSAAAGTISAAGGVRPLAAMPAAGAVTIRATAAANPSSSAQATVTLLPPVAVSVSHSQRASLGNTQLFTALVTGREHRRHVVGTERLRLVGGRHDQFGGALRRADRDARVECRHDSRDVGGEPFVLRTGYRHACHAPPPATWLTGARFLEQSSFGLTPAALAKVRQMENSAYLDESVCAAGDGDLHARRQLDGRCASGFLYATRRLRSTFASVACALGQIGDDVREQTGMRTSLHSCVS